MIRYIVLALCIIFASLSPVAAKVVASVSNNPVHIGQAFTLTITADKSLYSKRFNPNKLRDQGFSVGQTSVNRRRIDDQGKNIIQTEWTTTLLAKKVGKQTIPAFDIAGMKTKPIYLQVIPKGKYIKQKSVALKTSLHPQSAWMGQSLLYSAHILISTTLRHAEISGPQVNQGTVKVLGKDTKSTKIVNGRGINILTRRWLIKPERAGQLIIKSPHLTGTTKVANSQNKLSLKPVDITDQTYHVNVQKEPKQTGQNWLPATNVTISDRYSPQETTYTTGQVISREITITVQGANKDKLPNLDLKYPDSVRTYPEKSQDNLFVKDNKLYATRVYKTTIILGQSGDIQLPGTIIRWWNLDDSAFHYSQLKPVTLKINPDQSAMPSNKNDHRTPKKAEQVMPPKSDSMFWGISVWLWVWVVTLLLWISWEGWRRYHKQKLSKPKSSVEKSALQHTHTPWKQMVNSAKANNSQKTEHYLRLWLNTQPPEVHQQVKPLLNELAILAWAPGGSSEPWDGQTFLQRLKQRLKRKNTTKSADEALPPLNP